jgi:hypothetical protein
MLIKFTQPIQFSFMSLRKLPVGGRLFLGPVGQGTQKAEMGSSVMVLRLCSGSNQVRSPSAQVKAATTHVQRLKRKQRGWIRARLSWKIILLQRVICVHIEAIQGNRKYTSLIKLCDMQQRNMSCFTKWGHFWCSYNELCK